ncbi:MAG: tyrosine-type recombinase/integrase [Gemmataceae bacterium]|nr:tyrosine-type recombinase/integrase [Gemmataceae bacterium]
MAENKPVEPDRLTAAKVCDLFLDWSEQHNSPETFEWHRAFLQEFCTTHGDKPAAAVIPHHLTTWLDAHPQWKAGRRHATYCVKRAFAWAVSQGLLAKNPFAGVKVGRTNRREHFVTKADRDRIFAAVPDQAFRDFLTALQETGCRPSEIARVTAADVNLDTGVWVLTAHKTAKKTGRPRVVYLTPTMVELSRRLMAAWPEGPIFRTFKGKRPWQRNAIRCRFRRLRDRTAVLLGVEDRAKAAPQSFLDRVLERPPGQGHERSDPLDLDIVRINELVPGQLDEPQPQEPLALLRCTDLDRPA